MPKRFGIGMFVLCAGLFGSARPALAQQTFNFTFGYFSVRGEDARVENDIINTNRSDFAFDVEEFSSASLGGEWLVPLGQYLEAGAGVAFSRRTVPSVYQALVQPDGSEIEQEFRLRIVPMSFTVRVLPLGQSSGFQPYFGGGLGIFNWRYSESGEFVDRNSVIFRDSFVSSGNETGGIAIAGVRFAGDSLSVGGEVRYQTADASLGSTFAGITEPRIDLGGWTYQATVGVRFGR